MFNLENKTPVSVKIMKNGTPFSPKLNFQILRKRAFGFELNYEKGCFRLLKKGKKGKKR